MTENMYPNIAVRGNLVGLVSKDKDGEDDFRADGRTLNIDLIKQNIDTDEYHYRISFEYDDEIVELELNRGDLSRSKLLALSAKGADIFDHNVTTYIKHIRNEEVKASKVLVHHSLGWGTYKNKTIYKHHKAVGIDSTYDGSLAINPTGSWENWLKIVQEEVLGHTPLEAALVLGFSAVLVGFIGEELAMGSIIAHLSGDSTQGKTTAGQLAVSVGGYPELQKNGLMVTWNTTKNALAGVLKGNHGLPMLLDEASMSGIQDFTSIIYTLASGKEKIRMTKELEIKESGNWLTTILSTGEHDLTVKSKANIGIRMRLMEFSGVTWTKSATNAENIKQGVLNNYGHAAPIFAKYLVSLGKDGALSIHSDWKRKCLEALGDSDRFAPRLAIKLGVLMTTAFLVNEAFEFNLDLDKLMNFFLENEKSSMDDRDLAGRALETLLERVQVNQDKFSSSFFSASRHDNEFNVYKEHWGKWEYKEDRTELVIVPTVLKKILEDNGFEDHKLILKEWKRRNVLSCDSDRLTRKRKLVPNGPDLSLYIVVLPKEEIKKRVVQKPERFHAS